MYDIYFAVQNKIVPLNINIIVNRIFLNSIIDELNKDPIIN